jgi:hypothetical protein
MSQSTTLILLPQTTYQNPGNGAPYTVVGNAQPAAAYYLGNRDLQTVNLSATNLTGNIVIQATLANPATVDSQWFDVYELDANADSSGENSNAKVYTNITGNFVYMRAKIVDFQAGGVNFVKLSY